MAGSLWGLSFFRQRANGKTDLCSSIGVRECTIAGRHRAELRGGICEGASELRGDGVPRKMLRGGGDIPLAKFLTQLTVRQNAREGFSERVAIVHEQHPGFRDGRSRVSAAIADHGKAAHDSSNRAASTAGDSAANEKQNVRFRQARANFFRGEYSRNRKRNVRAGEFFAQS